MRITEGDGIDKDEMSWLAKIWKAYLSIAKLAPFFKTEGYLGADFLLRRSAYLKGVEYTKAFSNFIDKEFSEYMKKRMGSKETEPTSADIILYEILKFVEATRPLT